MNKVENEMKDTVARAMANGLKTYDSDNRHLWVKSDIPGQVVATVSQIKWTEET